MIRFFPLISSGSKVWLILLGFCCLMSCQSKATQEATTTAQTAALPAAVAVPVSQPVGGPLAPDRPTEAGKPAVPQPPTGPPPKDLHHKTVQNPDGTWGYDIFGDGKLLLRQPHIPALPGNAGFANEAQAARVANAALQKIKKGESLPTLSEAEVREMMAH